LYLPHFGKKVTVIHRGDKLRAQKIIQDRAFANDKMEFIWDKVVETINEENGKTGSVTMKNVKTGEKSEFKTDGVFIYIGMVPLSEPFNELGIVVVEGDVRYQEDLETSVPGI